MIPSRTVNTVDRSFYCGVLADWAAATLLKIQRGLELPRRTLLLLLGGDIGQVEADDRSLRAAGTSGAGIFDVRWAGSSAVHFVRYCVLRSLAVCACFITRVLLVQSFLDQRRRRRIDFRGHLFCPLASNGHSGALTAENALCVCMRAEDAPPDGPKSGWIQSAWTSVRYARATGASARAPGGGHGERQGEQVRHIVTGMRSGW